MGGGRVPVDAGVTVHHVEKVCRVDDDRSGDEPEERLHLILYHALCLALVPLPGKAAVVRRGTQAFRRAQEPDGETC